jgi:hypothetical protein
MGNLGVMLTTFGVAHVIGMLFSLDNVGRQLRLRNGTIEPNGARDDASDFIFTPTLEKTPPKFRRAFTILVVVLWELWVLGIGIKFMLHVASWMINGLRSNVKAICSINEK